VLYGGGHPYGRPIGGTDASTKRLDRARVSDFYARHYRPSNARLLVVGDVTVDEALALVEARFGGWERGEVPPLPEPAPPAPAARAFYVVDKPGAPQSVIRLGNVGVPRSTPDYHAISVMNTLLGGSFTSRLNQNLREAHGFTYGASSGFEMRRLAGPFRAGASVGTAVTDGAAIEFLKELRRIRDTRVSEEDLAKTRQLLSLGLPGDFETSASAAQRFVEIVVNDLPADTWDHYIDGIDGVTAADVQRVARRTLDPDHFVIVVVGDAKAIEPGLRALNEGPVRACDLWGAALR
jgi:zinc protease